jgi:acyl carrier protein
MTQSDAVHIERTFEGIRSWLVERVAHYVQLPTTEIDPRLSIAEYGLDSVYAFALCGEIEDTLGLPVEPTLLWDVDTVDGLAKHIVGLCAH